MNKLLFKHLQINNNNMTFDKIHHVSETLELSFLNSKSAFEQLTDSEKKYAYHMYKASWCGATITSQQVSDESYVLVSLFTRMFKKYNVRLLDLSDTKLKHFVNYVAIVFSNMGNYLSYGDSKVIPRLTKAEADIVVKQYFPDFHKEYALVKDKIFSLEPHEKFLGYPPHNVTRYFSNNITEDEAKLVDKFVISRGIEGWNTRTSKIFDSTLNKTIFMIHIASHNNPEKQFPEVFEENVFLLCYNDYNVQCEKIIKHLHKASKICCTKEQKQMLDHYITHFTTGCIDAHKKSQKSWVDDKMPAVETNIGFIESYRDPSGIRSEFESFVAVTNKEESLKLKKLVDNAESFLKLLPWPKEFEKDEFKPPDFTSLNVLTFVGSGIPAGINIPNYDDIRQNYGFKNVSLENVILAGYISDILPDYLSPDDGELFNKYVSQSFQIDVAGHELLGHGSGKLFIKDSSGKCNFNENTIDPTTGNKVNSWYENGETWGSKFGKLASSFEECRAECVGLYLSNFEEMHKIFYNGENWHHVSYVSWLWMIRTGILSLVAYDKDKGWQQAHSQARYVIYKVLRKAGIVTVSPTSDNFLISVDKSKISTDGMNALKSFLMKLNVYKATGNFEEGNKLFSEYSIVDKEHEHFREIHLNRRKPRTQFIQPTLKNNNGVIEYVSYNNTVQDMIQSFVDKKIVLPS